MALPSSAGDRTVVTPASSRAANLSAAVPFATSDNRASMAHSFSGWGGNASNVCNDRLGHVISDKFGSFFFGCTTDSLQP